MTEESTILVSKLNSGDTIIYKSLQIESGENLAFQPFNVCISSENLVFLVPFMFASGENEVYHLNPLNVTSTTLANESFKFAYNESLLRAKLHKSEDIKYH